MLWVVFGAAIVILFALDLGVFHKKSHAVGIKEALIWSGSGWLWRQPSTCSSTSGWVQSWPSNLRQATWWRELSASTTSYLPAHILLFQGARYPPVQSPLLGHRRCPGHARHIVFAGIELIEKFEWIVYVFGAFLLVSGLKLALRKDEEPMDVGRNPVPETVQAIPAHYRRVWNGISS